MERNDGVGKSYPLEVKLYMNDDYIFGFYTKGHHDKEEFLKACNDFDGGYYMKPGDVENETWRTVSTHAGLFFKSVLAGKGSYPVTVYRFYEPT
jgi:hypothetical protein